MRTTIRHSREGGNPCLATVDSRLRGNDISTESSRMKR